MSSVLAITCKMILVAFEDSILTIPDHEAPTLLSLTFRFAPITHCFFIMWNYYNSHLFSADLIIKFYKTLNVVDKRGCIHLLSRNNTTQACACLFGQVAGKILRFVRATWPCLHSSETYSSQVVINPPGRCQQSVKALSNRTAFQDGKRIPMKKTAYRLS